MVLSLQLVLIHRIAGVLRLTATNRGGGDEVLRIANFRAMNNHNISNTAGNDNYDWRTPSIFSVSSIIDSGKQSSSMGFTEPPHDEG